MNSFRAAILSGNGLHAEDPVVRDKGTQGAASDDLASVLIPRSEERGANHRDEDRHRLTGEQATAVHDGTAHEVEVINLSGGGAMIRCDFRPNLWDAVELKLGSDNSIEAAVRWLRDDRVGLEFAHETRIDCSPEVRDELLLAVIRRSFPTVEALPGRPETGALPQAPAGDDSGNRAATRHPLIWNGIIHYAHDSNRARLRNVSSGGALVEVVMTYPQGAEILLDLGDAGQFFATVNWTHGDQAGLSFKEPFDVMCLAKSRPDLTPHRWTAPGYLAASEGPSPWDEQWSRRSIDELRSDLEGYMKH